MKQVIITILGCLVLLTATGCADSGDDTEELTVFAAASLTEAFNDIKQDFEAGHPGVTVTFNFAGSQALATQLSQGASADLFASANDTQMAVAIEEGVIDGEPRVFTRNKLAIIVPSDNPAGLNEPADLASPDINLVVAAPDVPVGGYTLELLDRMSDEAGFGEGFRTEVEANFVSLESNVRQVVQKVALGEADAGIVYLTDITPDVAGDVAIIDIPDELNIIAEYPIARVQDGNTRLADEFIDWILSAEGQAVLQEYGFAGLP